MLVLAHFRSAVALLLPFALSMPPVAITVLVMLCKVLSAASNSISHVHSNELLPTGLRGTIRGMLFFVAA